ncbi:MAG: cupin domain-containing protein [Candidatus Tectomicrobia bacterium]|uniref:Cupin domain-containing protein n=1 Tax=Tectimicrobiota bacterium TaxID=2528274 RepID=A0A932HZI0_UNCTE|nr:cupin domain-containing protein [Candidatus Tectomicrobia bacterium]
MQIFHWDSVPSHPVRPGVSRKVFTGEGAMLLITEFGPGSTESPHTHPFEQLVFVLEGDVEFTLGGEKRAVPAGSVFRIPPGTPHGASALGGKRCRVLAVYGPPREDVLKYCDYQKE